MVQPEVPVRCAVAAVGPLFLRRRPARCAEYDAAGSYLQHIEAAARAAAAAALQLLLRDCGLLGRLSALRAHFMMGRGDCALYLMDIAEEELKKTAGQVSITRLQSLLELGARRNPFANPGPAALSPYPKPRCCGGAQSPAARVSMGGPLSPDLPQTLAP